MNSGIGKGIIRKIMSMVLVSRGGDVTVPHQMKGADYSNGQGMRVRAVGMGILLTVVMVLMSSGRRQVGAQVKLLQKQRMDQRPSVNVWR